jgi:hypothetical protein
MTLNLGKLSLLLKIAQSSSCKRTIDLQAFDKSGWGNKFHLGDFIHESCPGIFIKKHFGIDLFSGLTLVPLLLSRSTTSQGGSKLLLFGLLLNFWSLMTRNREGKKEEKRGGEEEREEEREKEERR